MVPIRHRRIPARCQPKHWDFHHSSHVCVACGLPPSALPETYQTWIKLNPLTFILEEGRKSLIFGQLPDALGWGIHLLVSIVIAWMGFWWFQKSRKGFADVL